VYLTTIVTVAEVKDQQVQSGYVLIKDTPLRY
jgi:hypothetical protein